ncbi:hypothetical protein BCR32DRAFT_325712 [Anaeromyces robustus]|uniref:Uncharacterized protein n=1 Tax=Anaeromyces robustus TaxID=1754192 RepID=A0A1Y1XGS1_9FUNG|nr:hypothetical protein BCR32DRAFT_325712 [Anaeromyces robustus]|eukprot:ORX84892.1 hypothetical protein BCR32DRAFT_325712 [Anaeromyces robustus]
MADLNIKIKPILDIIFKNLFGEKRNQKFMINFLNSILNREGNDRIIAIEYLKTGNTPIQVNKKLAKENERKRKRTEEKSIDDFGKFGDLDILVKNTSNKINDNNIDDNDDNNIDDNDDNIDDNDDNNNDNNNINALYLNNNYYQNIYREAESDIDEYNYCNIDKNYIENFKNKAKFEINSLLLNIKNEINNYIKKTIIKFNNDNASDDVDDEKLKAIMKTNTKKLVNEFLKEIYNEQSYRLTDLENNIINYIITKFCELNDEDGIRVKAKTNSDEYLNIEIQVQKTGNMFKRSLYYASGVIFQSLPRGNKYNDMPNLIMINILNYKLFKNTEKEKLKYHWVFTFKEKDTNEEKDFKGLLNIHFIELPKYKRLNQKVLQNKYPWILLLNDPNNKYFKEKEAPQIYLDARNELITLQKNPELVEIIRRREKEWTDYISEKYEIKMETKREKDIEHIFNLLVYLPLELVLNFDFPKEEVNCINRFMTDRNYSIEMLSKQLNFKKSKLLEFYNKSQSIKNKSTKRIKVLENN